MFIVYFPNYDSPRNEKQLAVNSSYPKPPRENNSGVMIVGLAFKGPLNLRPRPTARRTEINKLSQSERIFFNWKDDGGLGTPHLLLCTMRRSSGSGW